LVPDDLRAVAAPVLAHRMVLTAEAEPDPRARDGIIDEALAKVGYRPNARR
jgi:MoxR-like ATPase